MNAKYINGIYINKRLKPKIMFTLVLDKSKYYKIKCGQNAKQIQNVFKIPVTEELYCGKIICVENREYFEYVVKVGETYLSLAEKFGVDINILKKINGEKPVYPTCKIFVLK